MFTSESALTPVCAIVVPAYNAEATIGRAIDSVLAQTSAEWRLIVVDDGSADSTGQVARAHSLGDERVTIVRQDNAGVAHARNVGVTTTQSEYVVFLDADDELLPEYLATMMEFVTANPDYDIYHPNLITIEPGGRRSLFLAETEVRSFSFADLLEGCVIAVGGAWVRRELLERSGGFRENIHCEDYDLWLRVMAQGATARFLPTPLYVYHQEHPERRSADFFSGLEGLAHSLRSLIQEDMVPPELVPVVERRLEDLKKPALEKVRDEELERQAVMLRTKVESLFGARLAPIILSLAHTVTWTTRPLRRAIAKWRASSLVDVRIDSSESWLPRNEGDSEAE